MRFPLILLALLVLGSTGVLAQAHIDTDDSGNISIGDVPFFLDDYNDRLGLRTTTPEYNLDVNASEGVILSSVAPEFITSVSSSTYMNGAYDIQVVGDYAYIVNYASPYRLSIYDIADPENPMLVGSYEDATRLAGASGIAISGKYAFVTALGRDSIVSIDVSDPTNPAYVDEYQDATYLNGAHGIYISGKYAYIATYYRYSLAVIDISDPSNMAYINEDREATYMINARDVYVQGDFAYVTGYSNDYLTVVNITDPTSPTTAGQTYDNTYLNAAWGIAVEGSYAYVGGTGSFGVVNVSDPNNPVVIGGIYDATNLNQLVDVSIAGNTAFLLGHQRLVAVDISDPAAPFIRAIYTGDTLANSRALAVQGDKAYALSYDYDRLNIFDLQGLESPTASFSSLASDNVKIKNNMKIGNNAYVGTALNVGPGGIYADKGKGLAIESNLVVTGSLGVGTKDPANPIDVIGSIGTQSLYQKGAPMTVSSDSSWTHYDRGKIYSTSSRLMGLGTTTASFEVHAASTTDVDVTISGDTDADGDGTAMISLRQDAGKYGADIGFIDDSGDLKVLATNTSTDIYLSTYTSSYGVYIGSHRMSNSSNRLQLDPSNGVMSLRDGESAMRFELYNVNDLDVYLRADGGTIDSYIGGVNRANVGFGHTGPDADLHVLGAMCVDTDDVCGPYASGTLYVAASCDGDAATCQSDIAEKFPVSPEEPVEPGDVVVVDSQNPGLLTKSSAPFDDKVAGIFSTDPGIYFGDGQMFGGSGFENYTGTMHGGDIPLAIGGQVPVKVTDENGLIKKGDLLTTSSTVGHAMKWSYIDPITAEDLADLKNINHENDRRRNAILGKALESAESPVDTILALVTLQ